MIKNLLMLISLKFAVAAAILICFSATLFGQSALNFDGIDDVISATNPINIDGDDSRTVEAWIQTTESGDQHIVGWGILLTGRRFDLRLENSFLRLELENGFIVGLNTVLNDGEWHHVAVVVPEGATIANEILMYVDGVLEPHTEHDREIGTINSPISIGSNPLIEGREFKGSIDEVRVWYSALTVEEINYYMVHEPCFNVTIAARYSFDEGVVFGDNTGIGSTVDAISGNEVSLENFALNDSTSNFVTGIEFQDVTGTDTQVSCDPITWIDGNTYDSSNNSATFNIEGGALSMCDSLVTLDLTVVNADVTSTDPTITANFDGATYTWLDCDDNFAEIPNETGQSFTAVENGTYAVQVSFGGCSLTSECVTITSLGIEDTDIFEETSIYPNPNFGEVNIKLGKLDNVDVSIIDITGKSVFTAEDIRAKNYKFNLDAPAGMYLIELKSDGEYRNFRLVIQN